VGAYGATRFGETAATEEQERPAAVTTSASAKPSTATSQQLSVTTSVAPAQTGKVAPAPPPSPPPPPPPPAPPTTAPPTPQAGPPIMERGDSGDRVRELQARLSQIKWFKARPTGNFGKTTAAAVSGFQAKRGLPVTGYVDEETWNRLVDMTRRPTKEELFPPEPTATAKPVTLDPRCLTGRALCIDKSSRRLRWVIDGQIQMTLAVRFGSEFTPTREGAFDVYWKSRDHYSKTYDSPMPYAMFFSGGQAVHYSADFAARGYDGASHGCVNVRDKKAVASLFDQVRVGDSVIVYRS
jgi:hypothetical protein